MPQFPVVSMTEYVNAQKQCINKKVNNVHNLYLAYLHYVQHASAEGYQLDQGEFSYRFP